MIADALEEAGRLEDAQWLREAFERRPFDARYQGYANRCLMLGIRNRYPVFPRTIGTYGCVLCQTFHTEHDPEFWPHIHRQGKHQGPEDKVVPGEWVWENEPYWTRNPDRVIAALKVTHESTEIPF